MDHALTVVKEDVEQLSHTRATGRMDDDEVLSVLGRGDRGGRTTRLGHSVVGPVGPLARLGLTVRGPSRGCRSPATSRRIGLLPPAIDRHRVLSFSHTAASIALSFASATHSWLT